MIGDILWIPHVRCIGNSIKIYKITTKTRTSIESNIFIHSHEFNFLSNIIIDIEY